AETCATCHPTYYESFSQAEMGRSFRRATLADSDAPWDGVAPVYDAARDLYYQPFRRGEALFVREYRLAGRDTVHQRVEQIDYIVGSGHHTNSHIREENGYLYQIPVTWYAQVGRWGLAPGFESAGSRFSRPITEACMTCHNAMPGFVAGSENRFDRVPLGIDCERCHGPGSVHVREKRAGNLVDVAREVDYTIVNPGKLPPDLQMNVCERCHTQGAAVFREGRGPADFRPGMRLSDVEHVFWVRSADSTARFTMASHPDRLRMSACFEGSRRPSASGRGLAPMTCLTCHNPHVSIRTLGADHYDAACRNCHAPERPGAAPACTEPGVVRAGGTGNCVACHMPESEVTDIPNVRVTDHFIRRPDGAGRAAALSEDEVEARAAFVRLASLLGGVPTDLEAAEGYLTYYEEVTNRPGVLDSAAALLDRASRTTPLPRLAPALVRLLFLRGDYAAVRVVAREVDAEAVDDAWTQYRIGEAFAATGASEAALRPFRRAVALAPHALRFRVKLAGALVATGAVEEAVRAYDAVLEADPTFETAYNDRGWARVLLGDLAGAEADFRQALALDPDLEEALANLASLYYNTGRPAEARPLVRRLLRLDPTNPDYRRLEALVEAGA
ncbi:MAG TPA: tetratricopeptide repeat protein, partial [Rubricoccaceae bacterium]|nr:tetratricopeptide repeat protein [Rubricoccaceae bacterium]